MNERMMRLGGAHAAEFVTAFDESLTLTPEEQARRAKKRRAGAAGGNATSLNDNDVWLVWKYEGDNTLFGLMESKVRTRLARCGGADGFCFFCAWRTRGGMRRCGRGGVACTPARGEGAHDWRTMRCRVCRSSRTTWSLCCWTASCVCPRAPSARPSPCAWPSSSCSRRSPPRTAPVSAPCGGWARRRGGRAGSCGLGDGGRERATCRTARAGRGADWAGVSASPSSSRLPRGVLLLAGIVHRDVKPQNCIVSERDKKIKLIDLGAAADLRIGINYAPNEYLLDPRWATRGRCTARAPGKSAPGEGLLAPGAVPVATTGKRWDHGLARVPAAPGCCYSVGGGRRASHAFALCARA